MPDHPGWDGLEGMEAQVGPPVGEHFLKELATVGYAVAHAT